MWWLRNNGEVSQARPDRTRAGFGDLLRSMALLLIPILAFVGYQTLVRDEPDPIAPVDYAGAAAAVPSEAPFSVLVPEALPVGWRATSVRYSPGPQAHWHLGVLTADDEYVGLEQVVDDVDDAAMSFAPDTAAAGSITIAGQVWQRRTDSARNETALVRQADDMSIVVIGTVGLDVLVSYVESLRSAESSSGFPPVAAASRARAPSSHR